MPPADLAERAPNNYGRNGGVYVTSSNDVGFIEMPGYYNSDRGVGGGSAAEGSLRFMPTGLMLDIQCEVSVS